nr:bifunctional [glutamate--ammonia ligase]-adenylyl-L-tyrosine phosphorylase/[glutamate--ammonia-ligase] adenylyltransferase [Oceanobacter mangrovi]
MTDTGARFGLDWPLFWQGLAAEQQGKLQQVLLISQYVVDALPRDADYFSQLISSDQISQPLPRAAIHSQLNQLTGCDYSALPSAANQTDTAPDEDSWLKALRVLRRRAMVQIIWRDLLRLADTLTTTRAVSDLADETVCQSVNYFHQQLARRHGQPIGKQSKTVQHLLVLGMGKLGAYELNLSSDIDLIFTYPESGNTSGDSSGKKDISNQEFFVKLGQKLIAALDKQTIDGFVFRTDMRLRPYGQSGPLAMNFDSMEEYYQSQGRDWERYAMVKARIMNGEQSPVAQELLAILRPFTYRVYIDYSAFESLRSMKAMINAEVRRRGLDHNIKLGPGGIREVEFTIQAFQLIRGGQEKQLQQRELVPMIDILYQAGYLPADAAAELKAGYLFLRDVEHALQALNDEQTQLLPHDEQEQARIAMAMGFDNWQGFIDQLDQHRAAVKSHFAEIVRSQDEDQQAEQQDHTWLDLWHGDLADDVRLRLADSQPDMLSDEFAELISNLRESRAVASMQAIGHERLEALMPLLLEELATCPAPLATLKRVIPLLEAVLRRTSYLVLLKENPVARTQLIKLCCASEWVAKYITTAPLLLDELLNPGNLYRLPSRQELEEELRMTLLRIAEDDLEQQMEQLRQFNHAHRLHAAASEVTGALSLMKVSDYLTWLAEVTLECVMQLSWQQMVSKYGYPSTREGDPVTLPEFLVVGYGKVGGLELSYSSDLDLVFLSTGYAMGSTLADPDASQRSIDNNVFYTRMGQRMIHILTTTTRNGELYEVDMRLRPSGNSGMIVATMKAFEEYQTNHAWTWEHQALVRARVLCGAADLAQQFRQIRSQTLTKQRDIGELQEEVRSMRRKMRENLGAEEKSAEKFHLKHDAGGIVDIEFLVQYGVLAWAHQYPELLAVTDNMRLLDSFETVGLLDPQDRKTLQETYLSYRAETHRRALQNANLILEQATMKRLGFDVRRKSVTELWQRWLQEALD